MKYYVCSPIGRSGSKRIVFGLQDTLQANEKMFISLEGVYYEDNHLFQGFKLYRDRSRNDSDMYTNEQAIQVMNDWETPIVLHSHNVNLLPTDPTGWRFILSTRKRKIDIIFSVLLAGATKSHRPDQPIPDDFQPFEADIKKVDLWMEALIERENNFFNNIRSLTGKIPKVIYLEDTWQVLQQKAGIQFSPEAEHQDTNTISIIKAKDYITNYDEIQARYEEKLQDYQLRFPTETH